MNLPHADGRCGAGLIDIVAFTVADSVRTTMQSATRMVPAIAVAFLAGLLRALQLYAPQIVASRGIDAQQLGLILPLIGLLALAVSPFGAAIAGYVWGIGADVRDQWLRFTVTVVLGALAGFVVMSVVMIGLLVGTGSTHPGPIVRQVAYSVIPALGLVGVGFSALAGGAIGEFRRAGR